MSKRDAFAKAMGDNHAFPIIRSMYPSKSRGEMSKEFARLCSLGWDEAMKDAEAREAQLVGLVRELIFSHEQLEAGFAGMWGKPGIEWHEDAMATAPKWIANQLEKARAKLKELGIEHE